MNSLENRIYSSLYTVKLNNLDLNIDLDFIKQSDIFKKKNISPETDIALSIKKIEYLNIINFDNIIKNKYNSSLENILNKNYDIKEFINYDFYGNNINSPFISSRILRSIINNLNTKTIYEFGKRKIIIFSKGDIENKFINTINSIFNFFDILTNKENYYYLEFFLTSKKKFINFNLDSLDPDNINSGATLPGSFIYIFRKEEFVKVLFHELVHYLHLDMVRYQDKFKDLYRKINLKASIINPNEAYTELVALLLMTVWKYYENEYNINLSDFINKKLTIELGWSYYQISKILKFFKCYNRYEQLFSNNCEFRQNSNVLSYFILKTYFLQNINIILSKFNINDLKMNKKKSDFIFNNTNLLDTTFTHNINRILHSTLNNKNNDISLRMTCLN